MSTEKFITYNDLLWFSCLTPPPYYLQSVNITIYIYEHLFSKLSAYKLDTIPALASCFCFDSSADHILKILMPLFGSY